MVNNNKNKKFHIKMCVCGRINRRDGLKDHIKKAGADHMVILSRVACVKCRVLLVVGQEAEFYLRHGECTGGLVTDLRFVELMNAEKERMFGKEAKNVVENASGNVVENASGNAVENASGNAVENEVENAVAGLKADKWRKRVFESDDEDDVDLDRERVRKCVRKLSSSSSEVSNIVISDPPKSSSSPIVKGGGVRKQSARWDEDMEKKHVSQQAAHALLVDRYESLRKVNERTLSELSELKMKELKCKEVADENIRMRRVVKELKENVRVLEDENDEREKRTSAAERRMGEAESKYEELMKEMTVLRARNAELERSVSRQGDERESFAKLERMRNEWNRLNEDRMFEFHIPIRDNHLAGEVLVNKSLDESIVCYHGHPSKKCLHATLRMRGHLHKFSIRKPARLPKDD